jgi:hypothetical protein
LPALLNFPSGHSAKLLIIQVRYNDFSQVARLNRLTYFINKSNGTEIDIQMKPLTPFPLKAYFSNFNSLLSEIDDTTEVLFYQFPSRFIKHGAPTYPNL